MDLIVIGDVLDGWDFTGGPKLALQVGGQREEDLVETVEIRELVGGQLVVVVEVREIDAAVLLGHHLPHHLVNAGLDVRGKSRGTGGESDQEQALIHDSISVTRFRPPRNWTRRAADFWLYKKGVSG